MDTPDCLCSWDDIAVARALNEKDEAIRNAHDLARRAVGHVIRAGEELDALRREAESVGLRDAMDGVVAAHGCLDRPVRVVTGRDAAEDDAGCRCAYGPFDVGKAA